jgi:hypothetical protein
VIRTLPMNENLDKQFFVSVEFRTFAAVEDRRYKGGK